MLFCYELPAVMSLLSKRGLTDDQIRKILTGSSLEYEESLDDINACSYSSDSSEDSASEIRVDEMPPGPEISFTSL